MQSIQPVDPKPGTGIIVTFKNYKWAAEVLKQDENDLLKQVQAANRKDEVCVIRVPR